MIWPDTNGEAWKRTSMGLGDTINLSGAGVYLSKRDGPIKWHALDDNEKSVKSIFATTPEIEVVGVPAWWIFNPIAPVVITHTLLINGDTEIPKKCDVDLFEHIYRTHDIPYEVRWNMCPVKEAAKSVQQLPVPKGDYCFIHESDRGLIEPMREEALPKGLAQYRPDPGLPFPAAEWSILSFVDILQSATEIHVSDSAFFHLVESIETKAKLVLHNYVRKMYIPGWNDYRTKHKWFRIN